MTAPQITIPRETFDAMREALESSSVCIQLMSDGPSRASWGDTLDIIDSSLAAANAVSHQKPENTNDLEGGSITSESDMLTIAYMDGFYAGKKSSQTQAQKSVGKVCINYQGAWASLTGPVKEDDLIYTGPQRKQNPCDTCKHHTQGKNPLVGIYGMECFECTHYYASKWEKKEEL